MSENKLNISVGGAVKPSKWSMKIASSIKSGLHREDNLISVGDNVKAPFTLTTDIQPELRKIGDTTDDFVTLETGEVILNKRTIVDRDWNLSARGEQIDMIGEPINGEPQIKVLTQDGVNTINVTSANNDIKPSLFRALFPVRKLVSATISTGNILRNIAVRVIGCNEVGENYEADGIKLYKPATPMWTYIVDDQKVRMWWNDIVPIDRLYRIRYRIDNGEYQYVDLDGDMDDVGKYYEYDITLSPTQAAEVSLCVLDNRQEHFYTTPIMMSMGNDVNIKPPSNFTHSWLSKNELQLRWNDDYTVDKDYELVYSIDDGEEVTVVIPSESKDDSGRVYTHNITLTELQTINARVRMIWDMNTTQFATHIVLHNLATPTNIRFEIVDNGTKIMWDKSELAEYYKIFVEGREIGVTIGTETESIISQEINGDVYVVAYRDHFVSDPSESVFIKSRPNAPVNLQANFSETLDGYDFNVSFVDNSEIETSYRVEYTIDDGETKKITVDPDNYIPPNSVVDEEHRYMLWRTIETDGNDIVVNNGIEGRDVKTATIEGNTVKNEALDVSTYMTSTNSDKITIIDNTIAFEKINDGISYVLFKANPKSLTVYTVCFNIIENTISSWGEGEGWGFYPDSAFGVVNSTQNTIPNLTTGFTGLVKYKVTTRSDVSKGAFSFGFHRVPVGSKFKISNMTILEGDYTNMFAPLVPFGLTSTEASITNNSVKHVFYEPTISGETKIVDANGNECVAGASGARLSSIEVGEGLPILGSVPTISDTVDRGSGVVTLNTKEYILTGDESFNKILTDLTNTVAFSMASKIDNCSTTKIFPPCNKFKGAEVDGGLDEECIRINGGNIQIRISKTIATTASQFKTYLKTQYDNGTPIIIRYQLATPITQQLTPSQMSAYDSHKRIISLSKVGDVVDKLVLNEDGSGVWVENTHTRFLNKYTWREESLSNSPSGQYLGFSIYNQLGLLHSSQRNYVICNMFKTGDATSPTIEDECIFTSTGTDLLIVKINKDKLDSYDLSGFLKWVDKNELIATFRALNPTTTHIPKSLCPTIPINKSNILSFSDAVKPSKASVTLPTYKDPINVKFSTSEIEDYINIGVVAKNDLGETYMDKPLNIYVSPQPRWSYLYEDNQVLLDWVDKFDFETGYKIEYRPDGELYQYGYIDSGDIAIGDNVQYKFPLVTDKPARVRICCVSDQDHFYSKPIQVGKELDKTIVPPSNFRYMWLGGGDIEFSWTDDYICENGFNFSYSINDGEFITEFIPTESKDETKNTYTVVKHLNEMERITARVSMVWDLNESEYAQVNAIYIPSDAQPVTGLRRERTEKGVKISWMPQAAIETYRVFFQRKGDALEIYETPDDWLFLDLDYSDSREITIYVQAQTVGGSISPVEERMVFVPFEDIYSIYSSIQTKYGDRYYVNQIVYFNGAAIKYPLNQISMTEDTFYKGIVNQISYNPFTMEKYDINSVISNLEYRQVYPVVSSISKYNLLFGKHGISQVFSTMLKDSYDVVQNIFTTNRNRYPINSIISKVTIATMGDSITAGLKASFVRQLTYKNKFNCWNTLRAL